MAAHLALPLYAWLLPRPNRASLGLKYRKAVGHTAPMAAANNAAGSVLPVIAKATTAENIERP